jgi:8-oxo-dGTP pyrophosphatase MutT (NUDIX family)
MVWKPHATVAAIAEQEGRFLMVEESVEGKLVLNQPAGHIEDGESPLAAVVREALEETAWEFRPDAIVGTYLWREPMQGESYFRLAFAGRCLRHHPHRILDTGVIRSLWLTRDEIVAETARLRSPLVLLCVDDYLRGRRFPVDMLRHVVAPVAS